MTPSNPAPVGDEREALIDAWSMEEHGFPDQVWFSRKEVLAILARSSSTVQQVGAEWMPIETAPMGREMFVVRAFNVVNGFVGTTPYTSDPWCVWQDEPGKFARWPHLFAPTHWMALPKGPL